LELEKRLLHAARLKARADERRNKDRKRQEVARIARRTEKRTQDAVIKATSNSGRTARNGDHLYLDKITLDTKHQARSNPVVFLSELEKVRADAKRIGSQAGALVISNDMNRRVVVFALEDLPNLPL
jgi:predicted phage gp36 major capsid-like protein